MGGVSSFRKEIFEQLSFSNYFEGYGLYEDADFTLRLSKLGKLYVNTAAQLEHHHDHSGRPNKYSYGRMVARNGWYVWRIKHPKPGLKARVKWNLTFVLLMKLRFLNVFFTTKKRFESFTEAMGRLIGWLSLIVNKPKVQS
jgi:GT2 family glycosyltransferase